ncbi:MAG TPA: hotdog domain-containing protein [Acidimicrobiales bacterium]|nr:hotdog domain-containing protein [Acidimicrobiales bacterium]
MTTRQTEPHAGLSARAVLVVEGADTALALGSGDVPVLGTPRLIALCEEASTMAVAPGLPKGWTTVALRVQFDHLVPISVGSRVVAEAVLDRVEGRRYVFKVTVTDDAGLVGAGRVTRVAVERERFLARSR